MKATQHEYTNNQQSHTGRVQPVKRGRGRPPGSKNKPKAPIYAPEQEGWFNTSAQARGVMHQKKWQREFIRPQFVLTRKETTDIFLKFLKSNDGKTALVDLVFDGFPGIGKLSDASLGKYVERTGLLSRYPHDVIIKG